MRDFSTLTPGEADLANQAGMAMLTSFWEMLCKELKKPPEEQDPPETVAHRIVEGLPWLDGKVMSPADHFNVESIAGFLRGIFPHFLANSEERAGVNVKQVPVPPLTEVETIIRVLNSISANAVPGGSNTPAQRLDAEAIRKLAKTVHELLENVPEQQDPSDGTPSEGLGDQGLTALNDVPRDVGTHGVDLSDPKLSTGVIADGYYQASEEMLARLRAEAERAVVHNSGI